MITSILVICMGNLCRSPVAERLLCSFLPHITVHSVGLIASPGMPADSTMAELARENGIALADHCSQKFTLEQGLEHDLILVMEKKQARIISQQYPQLSGKCHLFTYWNGREDIPDPYKKSQEYYRFVYQRLVAAANTWTQALQD
ncbi:arsenate reductase/protein-tyrosine-phosphatase family protein [Buttiauxella agrestis]|nr:protein tyrosine phosphatase [Buttiauxella agrestis]